MKILKRVLAFTFALVLMQNVTVFAEEIETESETVMETEAHSGTCGENLTWEFDEDTGKLTISGTGEMTSVPWGGLPLKSVEIKEGVTNIVDNAFYFQGNLTSIKIPDTVTRIGNFAFAVCMSLETPEFPKNLEFIGGSAFTGCTTFDSVTLPEGLKVLSGSAFSDCAALEKVTIPDSVAIMGAGVFARTPLLDNQKTSVKYADGWVIGCDESVETVNLPEDTKGICPMAFMNCSEMTEISIPDSVKYIGLMAFNGCEALEKQNFSGITYVDGWAVSAQAELSSAMVLDKNTRGLCDNLFFGCSFRTMDVPKSVNYINANAFSTCQNLESIIVRNPNCVIDMTDDYSKTICNRAKTITEYYYTGILYGEEGSTAQTYAEKYDITFKPISELPTASEEQPCDLNHDGLVNAKDAALILMYAAEIGAGNFTGTIQEYVAGL